MPDPDRRPEDVASEIDEALEGVNLQELDLPLRRAGRGAPRRKSPGDTRRVRGKVVGISGEDVFVEVGPRAQGVCARSEFEPAPEIGAEFEFALRGREDELWLLSRAEAEALVAWDEVEAGSLVQARVTGQNTGGLELKIGPMPAFMPASHVGLRREEDLSRFLGQTFTCQVLEVDRERRRVLLSRRAVLERERAAEMESTLGKLAPGQKLRGKVTRVESFGGFVDLGGGIEGLVHVSNLSHRRVEKADEILQPGQEVLVQILSIEPGGKRIGLSMKTLEPDPWDDAAARFPADAIVTGKVVRLMDFGAFVELAPGLEGLLHVSQMARDRVRSPRELVSVGEELTVRVAGVESSKRRISLSLLDSRGARLGTEEAVAADEIDEALRASQTSAPAGTNLGALFRKALKKDQ